jgi:hypothetical protein
MRVEPELLHSGADVTHEAAQRVVAGAEQLAGASLPRGMFGDFTAAAGFHARLTVHHAEHVALMRQHHRVLTNIGDKAHSVARGFTRTEQDNTAAITSVGRAAH